MAYLKATAFVLGILVIGVPLLYAGIVLPIRFLGVEGGAAVTLSGLAIALIFLLAAEMD